MKDCFCIALIIFGAYPLGRATTITAGEMELIYSETLPGNLLPGFLFMQPKVEGGAQVPIGGGRGKPSTFIPDDSCGDDIFVDINEDLRSPQLPYLSQDLWTCDREMKKVPVVFMENEFLKVTINAQFGGRISSIFDKVRGKEYLFNNRAHQPANIGALKAWTSGGAEWNWSPGIIGHSAFTETTVWMQQIDLDKESFGSENLDSALFEEFSNFGPMLRVYEFDRYNGTTWQVDILLVDDSLIVHPKVNNPTNADLRGYWWTCVAVPATPLTRILTPATHVAETSRLSAADAPWPLLAEAIENTTFSGNDASWKMDASYLGNHPSSGDFFLRIPDTVYSPYIGHTQGDGFAVIHGHPLNGTKFFTWGQSGPGHFMQDFLSGGEELQSSPREGDYTELQVGLAPTQMQTFSLPAQSIREWTEWFKAMDGEPRALNSAEYTHALDEVDRWMRSPKGMPKAYVDKLDSLMTRLSSWPLSLTDQKNIGLESNGYNKRARDAVLVKGQPWGALEQLRTGKELSSGLYFGLPQSPEDEGYAEAKPWLELLETGTFSSETLSRLPVSYQTTDPWLDLLRASAQREGGNTWLHSLHIAVGLTERGTVEEPRELFKESMTIKPNPIAARCLAVLSSTTTDAWTYYLQAWSLMESFEMDPSYDRLAANLVTEMAVFLQQQSSSSWADEWTQFLDLVPPELKLLDAVLKVQIMLSNSQKYWSNSVNLLSKHCFPTYATDRDDLMTLWNTAVEGIAGAVTSLEKHRARVDNPIPRNIGCQKGSKYCLNYWR